MKKRLFLFLMTLLPMLANAHDFEVNGLCYNLVSLDDKVVCLTRNPDGYSGDIVIPSTITVGDYTFKVDSIGDNACASCYGLNSITIEEGVKKIGKQAFYSTDWNRVEYIKIPKSLTYIDTQAFDCMVPTNVYIADLASWCNIEINSSRSASSPLRLNINAYKRFGKNIFQVFVNNMRVTDLILPEGVERVNDLAFWEANLSSVTFPNSAKYISGFKGSYIEKVILGNQTETIGFRAFEGCKYLKSIHMPKSVTKVESNAFNGCHDLDDLIISEGTKIIEEGAFSYCTSIPEIIIGNQCEYIGSYAFQNCSKAKKLYLGSAVTTIDDYAFDGCANLDSIIVNATTPPSIAENSFSTSSKLVSKLIVPKGCKQKYQEDSNWSSFNNIVEMVDAKVELSKTDAIIEKGKTLTLKATVTPTDLPDKSVTWESSNTKVATVTSAGKVKGVKVGTATITCTSNFTGAKATCNVTVGKVTLSKTEATVLVGKSGTLKATVYPTTLADKSVTWKTSNKKVAKVSTAGKVKAVGVGSATITCTSNATGLKATCTINVVKGIVTLNKTETYLQKGKTMTLKATVTPETLTDKSVTWESSDPKIVKVSSAGKMKGMKYGTATITCTSVATGAKATCQVTVGKVIIGVSEITIKKSRETILIPALYPSDLADKSVTWKSSDESIATVTSEGKVTGVKAGTATITCTSVATGLKDTCTVTVLSVIEARSVIGNGDGSTGIKDYESSSVVEPFDVYDLSGRKVRHQVNSLDGLPDGIYIINGKKVLKK